MMMSAPSTSRTTTDRPRMINILTSLRSRSGVGNRRASLKPRPRVAMWRSGVCARTQDVCCRSQARTLRSTKTSAWRWCAWRGRWDAGVGLEGRTAVALGERHRVGMSLVHYPSSPRHRSKRRAKVKTTCGSKTGGDASTRTLRTCTAGFGVTRRLASLVQCELACPFGSIPQLPH
jgi:hypothetical protein